MNSCTVYTLKLSFQCTLNSVLTSISGTYTSRKYHIATLYMASIRSRARPKLMPPVPVQYARTIEYFDQLFSGWDSPPNMYIWQTLSSLIVIIIVFYLNHNQFVMRTLWNHFETFSWKTFAWKTGNTLSILLSFSKEAFTAFLFDAGERTIKIRWHIQVSFLHVFASSPCLHSFVFISIKTSKEYFWFYCSIYEQHSS